MRGLKMVVIGGGSSYTPELVDGLIRYREQIPLRELVLVDVPMGAEKLAIMTAMVERMLAAKDLQVAVSGTMDRRQALAGADVVISQFRVGGLPARALDERLPLKWGVIGQETTGPGGFAKALRTIPVALQIAHDVEELCPDAWVLNFTNPSGVVTEALMKHSRVKTVGLCNVPLSIQRGIAAALGVDPARVVLDMAGLNHLSFARHVYLDGTDILPKLLGTDFVRQEIVKNIGALEWGDTTLQALGMLPSPYLQYYYGGAAKVEEEKQAIAQGRGTRADEVMRVEAELFKLYRDPATIEKPALLGKRGGAFYSEAALGALASILQNRREVHIVNTRNGSCLPDLGPDVVVEVPCVLDATGAHPLTQGPLPTAVRGLVQQVKAYEELTIEAAVTGDRHTAFLALLNHPLVPGAQAAAGLLQDILASHREYLPQFFPASQS